MSDLIDRRKALDGLEYEMKYGAEIDRCGLDTAYDIIENIQSAEPERTAKVEKVDTNSPHSQVYKCCKCGQYTHRTAWSRDVVYCPSCGCRLEWE